ncbi:UNVERIFIED_CONTAM: hypothetical protein GTU68_019762, partial [Idotea baltica]|nr:hypothetical protein [Idotea baltica]
TPCVISIFGFASCFLFSVETQHTIGYGSRHTTEECPEAIFVMCLQSITGVILQAFMGGVIFTKLSRPKKRTHTLIFSREACICLRDGELCLLFRVGDMRKSHIIEAHIRVQLIKERVTEEGETIPYFQHELDVGYDGGEDRILFIWPMTIVHKIDESSPLYEVSAHELSQEKFEIIVMLEGVIENTGTDYRPSVFEITAARSDRANGCCRAFFGSLTRLRRSSVVRYGAPAQGVVGPFLRRRPRNNLLRARNGSAILRREAKQFLPVFSILAAPQNLSCTFSVELVCG